MIRIKESTFKKIITEAIISEISKQVDKYLKMAAECHKKEDWDGFETALDWLGGHERCLSSNQLKDYHILMDLWADENLDENILSKDVLSEGQQFIDNFDMAAKLLNVNSPDDFHFVQITKRFKDNPNDDRSVGNYHGGAWYLKGYRVHNAQELLALKPEIITICEKENARAYITINNRSEKETDSFIKIYRKKFRPTDARYKYADQIIPGQAKDGPNWKGVRKRVLVDIDVPKTTKTRSGESIWDEVRKMIKMVGITPITEYETPSGGLHIVLPDKEDANFVYLKKLFEKFDNWRNKGRLATVHPNTDAKIILYSNVKTKGY